MNKKYLLVGMAAILGASLSFFACDSDSDTKTETVYVDNTVEGPDGTTLYLDELAIAPGGLTNALEFPGELTIGVYNPAGFNLGATVVEIPADKTVYILNNTTLDVDGTGDLKVAGKLYVGKNAALKAACVPSAPGDPYGTVKVGAGGLVSVLDGGTFILESDMYANDGELFNPSTVLGPDKNRVKFTEKATLKVTELGGTAEVDKYLNYLTEGTLEVVTITALTGVKPSDLAGISSISDKRQLKATATADETEKDLVIPVGANISSDVQDDLAAIETLTVNGTLTDGGSATLVGVTNLTINATGTLNVGPGVVFGGLTTASGIATGEGKLVMGTGDFGPAAAALLGIKNVTSPATAITGALTVPSGTTLTLTGAAAPTLLVTVEGKLVITGKAVPVLGVTVADGGVIEVRGDGTSGNVSLAIDASQVLQIESGGKVNLVNAGSLKLASSSAGASVKGDGMLKAGSTVIVGGSETAAGWLAYNGNNTTGTITIEAGATGATTTNTATIKATVAADDVLTAQGPGATITQLAEEGNNLTLGDATGGAKINLDGDSTTPDKGRLVLTGHPNNPGKITLAHADSAVKTSNVDTSTVGDSPTKISGKLVGKANGTLMTIKGGATASSPPTLLEALENVGVMTGGPNSDNTIVLSGTATVDLR
jgi:hypothetical protein